MAFITLLHEIEVKSTNSTEGQPSYLFPNEKLKNKDDLPQQNIKLCLYLLEILEVLLVIPFIIVVALKTETRRGISNYSATYMYLYIKHVQGKCTYNAI